MQKTYDRQTAQFLAVVAQNMPELSSIVMQRWIQDPLALKAAMRVALLPKKTVSRFSIWMKVKLGPDLETVDDFTTAISCAGMTIDDASKQIIDHSSFAVSLRNTEVELVNVSVRVLGFSQGASFRIIVDKALSLGLELCPPEVVPKLRMQYVNQPAFDALFIGMKSINIPDNANTVGIFYFRSDGECMDLLCHIVNSRHVFDANKRFLFVQPRK